MVRHQSTRRRVFIVDDHPIVRHGISVLINQQKDLVVSGEADNHRMALKQITAVPPDVVIVDMTLRKADGLALIKNLRAVCPALPVLVLSIHDETLYAARALRAGARGYLMKQEATDKVLTALRTVLDGECYLSARMQAQLGQKPTRDNPNGVRVERKLSDRELEIFRMLGRGLSTREIAVELHLSASTIETHRYNIKTKLGLVSAVALVQYATRWVESDGAG